MQFEKTLDFFVPVSDIAASPDGGRLVIGLATGDVRVWDAKDGVVRWSSVEVDRSTHYGRVAAVAWSPDGTRVVSGGQDDGNVQIRDAETGRLIVRYMAHQGAISDIVWSPASTQIGSACEDGTVHIWDAKNNANLHLSFREHASAVQCLAWSHSTGVDEAMIVSGDRDGRMLVWSPSTGELLHEYLGHQERTSEIGSCGKRGIAAVSFSPDDSLIASTSRSSSGLHIWTVGDGVMWRCYPGGRRIHHWRMRALGWKTSREVIAASEDGSLHVVSADCSAEETFQGVTVGSVGRVLNTTTFVATSCLDWYVRQWSL